MMDPFRQRRYENERFGDTDIRARAL